MASTTALLTLLLCTVAVCLATETSGLVGGIKHLKKLEWEKLEDLMQGLKLAEKKLNDRDVGTSESGPLVFLNDSFDVSSQVVEGVLYRVKVKAAPKTCLIQAEEAANCEAQTRECSIEIWSRVWLPSVYERLKVNLHCG